MNSDNVKKGPERAPNRSLFYALGYTPEELDRKFGRLLWLGKYLVEKDVRFEIRTLTADGVQSSWVQTEQELNKATDTLLCAGEAKEGSIRDFGFAASWQYHIGGEPDEAKALDHRRNRGGTGLSDRLRRGGMRGQWV